MAVFTPGTITMPGGSGAPSIDRILVVSQQGREDVYALVKLSRDVVRVGEAKDNDIVIDNPVVSAYHFTLQLRSDGCYLIDGQDRIQPGKYERSANGVFLNDGQHIFNEHKLESGERFHILAKDSFTVTFTYSDVQAVKIKLQSVRLDKDVTTIGRNETNDMVLPILTVSSLQAQIVRKGKKYELIHKGKNPTYVNGAPIMKHELKNGDKIGIGSITLEFDGVSLLPPASLGQIGPRVDAINVSKTVSKGMGKKKTLLDKISVPILPGEFVALVGGSGAGKSTLLKSMIGIIDTDKGSHILINNEDLFANFDQYRRDIGYVPQEDIIHDGLTVEQVMDYVIRLRDRMSRKKRKKFINEVLDKVKLTEFKSQVVRTLSGGQKKRLNVAVELAANPPILVLDEPTSGLDPGLDLTVMEILSKLAHEDRKTIILVTHTTENIDRCDKVVFLAERGRLTFFGTPAEAKQFFGVDKFPKIYSLLDQKDPKTKLPLVDWPERYKSSSYYQQYIVGPMNFVQAKAPSSAKKKAAKNDGLFEVIRQTLILAQRHVSANRLPLLLLLVLPVFLGFMFFTVADKGLFATLDVDLRKLAEMQIDPNARQAFFDNLFKIEQVLFMISTISVFLGLFGSFQDIVKERPIYDRERLVNLNISAYVFSKVLVLGILAAIQATILVYVINYRVEISGVGLTALGPVSESIISVFLVILASAMLGLAISAVVNRERDRTVFALVLVVTIQILFSGAIFKLEGSSEWLTWLTFTRWGSEALGSAAGMHAISSKPGLASLLSFLQMQYGDKNFLFSDWGRLALYSLGFLILTIFSLNRQDIVRKRLKQK